MTASHYSAEDSAILLVDPYNDFLAAEGKLWPLVKEIAEQVNLLDHLRDIMGAARKAGLKVFFVPHHRAEPTDYQGWKHVNSQQAAAGKGQVFAKGTWGGEFHDDFKPQPGDVVIKEHWAQSGFANTDLDQQLKQYGIQKLILIGMLANSCIESTARWGMELGYHVTLVTDATAAFGHDEMHTAHKVSGPLYAHAMHTTAELTQALAPA
ncbi:cysteine hydrolase family protein [Caballeronia sp. 15715]|uniref:cysteine hydrolase family protein n=1 Tax=Caballeronia sp. 15715 TaxID=3391030 RepID=UPI0039E55B17